MQNIKNKFFFRLLLFMLFSTLIFSGCATQNENMSDTEEEHARELFAMGTYITLSAYGEAAEDALVLSEYRIKELNSMWSITDTGSDICQILWCG